MMLFISIASIAQVSIAPTAVFFDKNGVGSLYITNNSETPQEITVGFQFGYSDQDERGTLIMVYDDTTHAATHGIKNLSAFPRAFNLPPKTQQLVRLQVRGGKNMSPGTYFTRIKIGSSAQASEVGAQAEGITTRVNVKFEQVIVGFYKVGATTTGVAIEKVDAKTDSNFISIGWNYKTTGNSPYLGRVKATLKAPNGTVLVENSQSAALYFSSRRLMNFRLDEVPKPGRYELELKFETVRGDMAQEDLVQAAPYVFKTYLQLP